MLLLISLSIAIHLIDASIAMKFYPTTVDITNSRQIHVPEGAVTSIPQIHLSGNLILQQLLSSLVHENYDFSLKVERSSCETTSRDNI